MQPNNHFLSLPLLDLAIDYHPLTVAPETPLIDVINLMNSRLPQRIDNTCVLAIEGTKLVGLFTAFDVMQLIALGQELTGIKLSGVMNQRIISLQKKSEVQDISEALLLLRQHKLSHLPVVDELDKLLGVVTPESICKVLQPKKDEGTIVQTIANHFAIAIEQSPVLKQNPKIMTAASHAQEVSDRLQAQAARQQANDALEVEKLIAGLKDSNKQLQAEVRERRSIEHALRQSEKRYRLIAENSTDMISTHTPEGIYLYVSPACRTLLGYEPEELVGHFAYEFFHPDDLSITRKSLVNILSRPISDVVTYRIRRKDGNYIWFETTSKLLEYSYLGSEEDTPTRAEIISVSRDISRRKQAEKALTQAQEQLQAVLNGVPGLVSWIDSDLRYIGVNQHLAESFNYPPEAFVGQEVGFLECSPHFAELMRRFFASPAKEMSQEVPTDVNGSSKSFLIVAQKYDNDQAAFSVGIDITERKRAEEELRATMSRLTTLIKNLQAGILVENESRQIVLINQEFCEMFGLPAPPTALIGLDFSQFPEAYKKSFSESESFVQGIQTILAARQVVTNEELYLVDGRTFERDYVPIFIEETYSGHLWMYRDITERKRAETALLKTQEELRLALEKEKELNDLKSRFVSMTSHEFRTPLSTILSSAELLEHYGLQWTEEKRLKHLHRIQTSVKHMTQLLNDVLVIGKAEAGQLEFNPAPIDVVQFCQELVEELQLTNCVQHAIAFTNKCECTDAYLDEKLLRQIFGNLLSNAMKYSPVTATVKMALSCQNGQAVFQIQDQGIGIPLEDQKRLFESFHRATNVGNIPGTGLGLAIVKKCVDLHGGKIAVNTEIGVGTTFTVTLPFKKV